MFICDLCPIKSGEFDVEHHQVCPGNLSHAECADQLFDLIHELEFNILGIPCPGHLKKTDQPVVKPG